VIGIGEVLEAAARIEGRVRETPLERSPALSAAAGREVLLKLESMQRTGSFKVRGAMSAMAWLSPEARERGVVTASAGNHGLGVALAAAEHGVTATVTVPAAAPAVKRERIAALGARLVEVDGDYDEADAVARREAESRGVPYIHAFSDPAVVAGQGTVGLEIARARPNVSTILVPVGGGGLIGGVGTVARAMLPGARVVGVQSVHTSAMHDSLLAGDTRPGRSGPTICDGLAGETDEPALSLARVVVDEMILVEEAMVRDAIRRLYLSDGVVAEGSGAVAAAAILNDLVHLDAGPGPLVVVITGANIDARALAGILSDGA
jgi:threonine dehydratase